MQGDAPVQLDHRQSSRRDFRSYALLFVGLAFVLAGATVDPARNCDESGRECAPWLVPLGFCLGLLATAAGVTLLVKNFNWGCRVDLPRRQLSWWDTRQSDTVHQLALDEVMRIEVHITSEGSDQLRFYDRQGALLPVPKGDIFPHPYEGWARLLASHFPHIAVEVDHALRD